MARKVTVYILIALFMLISFPLTSMAEAISKVTVKELIVKHSTEMGLDPALALSIAKKESNYCHNSRSRYGAIGVFQVMPRTAKFLGYNPYKINDNIKAGITYYQKMYKMFGSIELALAAYNAGPGNVRKYRGIPPFKETRRFVSVIMNDYNSLKANPDPAIIQYRNGIKDVNLVSESPDIDVQEVNEVNDFRQQQQAIIEAYLSNQGI